MHLKIMMDRVYGREVYYPVNEQAKALAQIAGSKTLTPSTLKIAREGLGATVELVAQSREF